MALILKQIHLFVCDFILFVVLFMLVFFFNTLGVFEILNYYRSLWLCLIYLCFLLYLFFHILVLSKHSFENNMSHQSPSFNIYEFYEISKDCDQTNADEDPSQLVSDFGNRLLPTEWEKNAQVNAVHKFVEKTHYVIWSFFEWPKDYH